MRDCQDHKVIELEEIDSTNTYAKSKLNILDNGTIVLAHHQTQGRGRLGKEWLGEGQNMLTFSYVLKGIVPHTITEKAALAVYRSIEKLVCVKTQIKWPNDIIINQKKVCGILCESRVSCDNRKLFDVVVGIGVNLHTDSEFFRANSLDHATSIFTQSNQKIDKYQLMHGIVGELDKIIDTPFPALKAEYVEKCATIGRTVSIINSADGTAIVADAVDIDNDGQLICSKDGNSFSVGSGEVSVRGVYGYV